MSDLEWFVCPYASSSKKNAILREVFAILHEVANFFIHDESFILLRIADKSSNYCSPHPF